MRRIYLVAIALLLSGSAYAQLSVSLGLNVASQPEWGPSGYDHVDYYYLPDIGVYYNVPQHLFYYNEGGRWIGRGSLPPRYHDFDLYGSYKVVVNERRPYMHDNIYREKYSSFRGRHDQHALRENHEARHVENKGRPEQKNHGKQQARVRGNEKAKGHDEKRER
jgi:hypothetical protein